MSSSFALWWRRAFSSHSPPPEAILSLFMYTWPTIAHSFRDMSSHPWKARICITNLSQDFSSSFWGICAGISSYITSQVPQIWQIVTALLSLTCRFIQWAFLHPDQSITPTFPALMHQLQAQRQIKSPGKWVYEPIWAYQQPTESVSAAVFYLSFSWEMFHHTFCDDPVGNLLIIFQSDSHLKTSFQNQNLSRRRKLVTCFPQFSGTEKRNLENFYNSTKLTQILRIDC